MFRHIEGNKIKQEDLMNNKGAGLAEILFAIIIIVAIVMIVVN